MTCSWPPLLTRIQTPSSEKSSKSQFSVKVTVYLNLCSIHCLVIVLMSKQHYSSSWFEQNLFSVSNHKLFLSLQEVEHVSSPPEQSECKGWHKRNLRKTCGCFLLLVCSFFKLCEPTTKYQQTKNKAVIISQINPGNKRLSSLKSQSQIELYCFLQLPKVFSGVTWGQTPSWQEQGEGKAAGVG